MSGSRPRRCTDAVRAHKDRNEKLEQYPVILTKQAWSIRDLLCGIKKTRAR